MKESFKDNLILVDDDFLTESEIQRIENTIRSKDFMWSFIKYGVDKDTGDFFSNSGNFHNLPFLTHYLYEDGKINSPYYHLVGSILSPFLWKYNIDYDQLLRARVNLDFNITKESLVGPPHVDHSINHYSFIYYLGDSDGDTVFFNKKNGDSDLTENLKEEYRVTPKRGRAVLFDGNIFHGSTTQTNSPTRTVVNMSFI